MSLKFQNIEVEGVRIIRLTNDENQILFSVSPEYGARLVDLYFKNKGSYHSVTWPVSAEDCKTGAWSKNEILFPFPNRIDGGLYSFEGKSYQLPINEQGNNNAIHGMVAKSPFNVHHQEVIGNVASITLRHVYDGSKAYYPFAFVLDATFVYDINGAFKLILSAKNTGTKTLPFGLGWHPYFKIGDNGLNTLILKIPEIEHLILGERNLPTGEAKVFNHTSLKLSDWALDDCFRLKSAGMSCELASDLINLKMEGSDEYQYLQIFTPDGLGTVAVEPMTSGVNVFNNREGLRLLKPSESLEVFFTIAVG